MMSWRLTHLLETGGMVTGSFLFLRGFQCKYGDGFSVSGKRANLPKNYKGYDETVRVVTLMQRIEVS